MITKAKIKELLKKGLSSNPSPHKLAFSFCIGIYVAFSPFPGGHTIMMLAFKWFFGLNFPILFIATSFNNPWTMIPFFSFDYIFGYWVTHSLFGLNDEYSEEGRESNLYPNCASSQKEAEEWWEDFI